MSTTNSLGLSLSVSSTTLKTVAAAIAWNWLLSHAVFVSRHFKQWYGIDHQGSPRQDLNKYGAEAVKAGKLTQRQLDQIYRVEAASANTTEGFPLFTTSVLFGLITGVPESKITTACTVYSLARIAYGVFYITISDNIWALSRTLAWYVANGSCLYLLWNGAHTLV